MNGLGTGRSSHGSGQLWGRPWWSPQCPCAGEILSGRGQAPPLRSSAVPRFSHIQAGAAGALQRKPPPPESRRQNSPGEVPRRGNRNSPFLAVSRGGLLRRGKSESPALTGSFAPFWPLRKGPAGGMTRKQIRKRFPWKAFQPGIRRADVGIGPYGAGRAAIKAAPTEPRMHRPIGAREAAPGRRPLRKTPGIEKGRLNCQPSFFSYFFKRSSIASSRSRDFGTRVFLESAFNGSTNLLSREDINFLRFTKTDSAI